MSPGYGTEYSVRTYGVQQDQMTKAAPLLLCSFSPHNNFFSGTGLDNLCHASLHPPSPTPLNPLRENDAVQKRSLANATPPGKIKGPLDPLVDGGVPCWSWVLIWCHILTASMEPSMKCFYLYRSATARQSTKSKISELKV